MGTHNYGKLDAVRCICLERWNFSVHGHDPIVSDHENICDSHPRIGSAFPNT